MMPTSQTPKQEYQPIPLTMGPLGIGPQFQSASSLGIVKKIRTRQPFFTPEWVPSAASDAGDALVALFADQLAAVQRRANRLPDKAMLQFLQTAGIQRGGPRPAVGFVQFSVSPVARQSIVIPSGFQVGAPGASESGDIVTFETQNRVFATPGEITRVVYESIGKRQDLSAENKPGSSFYPLGTNPMVGDAVLLGVKMPPDAPITGGITLGVHVAAMAVPPPSSAGSPEPTPTGVAAVLRWEAQVGGSFQPLSVEHDETDNLSRSGIVQLGLPTTLHPTLRPGEETPLVWLRVRLVHGGLTTPPMVSFFHLNTARVLAIRTIRDEILQPLDGPLGRRLQLSQFPVLPHSVEIVSQETALVGNADTEKSLERRWKRIDSLELAGPDDDVYQLDPATGILTFGDGLHGANLPPGFRNVRASRYQVQSGKASSIDAEQITVLLNSVHLVTGVTNLLPAVGGYDAETVVEAVRRGPGLFRSGSRTVTVSDYEVLAIESPGANIGRAQAIPGYHPLLPGRSLPGVVGVLCVSRGEEEGPPIPDELSLQSVARYLSQTTAPSGVEIIACAPRFAVVSAEVHFIPPRGADVSLLLRSITERITNYLHPLFCGESGSGWPFGGMLNYRRLLSHLTKEDASTGYQPPVAIERLRLFVEGELQPNCADIRFAPDTLIWPDRHQLVPLELGDEP